MKVQQMERPEKEKKMKDKKKKKDATNKEQRTQEEIASKRRYIEYIEILQGIH